MLYLHTEVAEECDTGCSQGEVNYTHLVLGCCQRFLVNYLGMCH